MTLECSTLAKLDVFQFRCHLMKVTCNIVIFQFWETIYFSNTFSLYWYYHISPFFMVKRWFFFQCREYTLHVKHVHYHDRQYYLMHMNYNVTHSNTKNWNTKGKYLIKSKYIHSEQGYPFPALIFRIFLFKNLFTSLQKWYICFKWTSNFHSESI